MAEITRDFGNGFHFDSRRKTAPDRGQPAQQVGFGGAKPGGFGPAAHSFYEGRRFYRPADWEAFYAGAPSVDDGPGGDFEERLMLALRLKEGYRGEIPAKLREKASQPMLAPYLEVGDHLLRLTKEGFLVSNRVLAELI